MIVTKKYADCTICTRSSDPFYIVTILYKTGNFYFLDTQYKVICMYARLSKFFGL